MALFVPAFPPLGSASDGPGVGGAQGLAPQPLALGANTVEIHGSDPDTLDPAVAYDDASGQVIQAIYETLITYDGSSADVFVPLLAEQIPTVANGGITNNNLTYTFDIKHGITFASGDTLDADDVVYSFKRVILIDDPASPAWILTQVLNATSIAAVDSDTVSFTLTHPYAAFLSTLAYTVASIVSKETVEAHGGTVWYTRNDWMAVNADGTGPFVLSEWNAGLYVSLGKNTNYWNSSRAARVDSVLIRNGVGFTTSRDDLLAGRADIISVASANRAEMVARAADPLSNITVNSGASSWITFSGVFNFAINTSRRGMLGSVPFPDDVPSDFFADAVMRRAFASAFDYDDYLDNVAQGYAGRQRGIIPEGMYGYDGMLPVATFDLDAARGAYNQSRWVTDGLYNPGGYAQGFNLTIAYNLANSNREQAGLIWKRGLEQLGPNVHVNVMGYDFAYYLGLTLQTNNDSPGPVPLFFVGWGPDYADPDDYVVPFLRSGATYPFYTGFSNASLDALIDQAAVYPNSPSRLALYDQIQRSAVGQDVYLYVSEARNFHVANSSLKGWYYNPMLSSADLGGPLWALYWEAYATPPDTTPPSVTVAANVTATAGEVVWLNGSATDNDPAFPAGALFMWSFTYNGSDVSRPGPQVNFLFWVVGNYTATLRVTDAAGNVGLRTMTVIVVPPETLPPIVDAGADRTATAGTAVPLSGSATDNDPLFPQGAAYGWNFTYNATAQALSGQSTSFTFWVTGVYTITMWATDFWGNRGEDSFALTVGPPDTVAPLVNAGPDRTATAGRAVHFQGTASDNDPAFPAGSSFDWSFSYQGSGVTLHGQEADYTFNAEGIYTVLLSVTDAWGNVGTDSIRVTVGPADTAPPTVAVPPDRDAQLGEEITFEATATDNSADFGAAGNYTWSFSYGGAQVRLYGSAVTFAFDEPGTYVVTLLVQDGTGNAAAAREFVVRVAGPDFTAPVVTASATPAQTSVGEPVTLTALATDNGEALTQDSFFVWTFDYAGGTRTLVGARAVYTFAIAGVYNVRLDVTDRAGNVASANVTVTVREKAQTPGSGVLPGLEAAASVVALAAAAVLVAARRRR